MKQFATYLALAAFLNGCAPRHPSDMARVDSLRVEAEELIRAQSLMGYRSWAFGAPSNQDSLYRAHEGLFAPENLDLISRAEAEEADSLQKTRLFYFRRYLTLEALGKATAPLADRSTTYAGEASILFEGKKIAYRQIPILLANEGNPARRAALYRAANPVLDTLSDLAAQTDAVYSHLARDLGYRSYSDMIEKLKGFSLESVGRLADSALAETDSLYFALLPEMLRVYAHLDTSTFYRYDTGALFRVRIFDRYFPKSEVLPSVEASYRSLGVDPTTQTNLHIDTVARPGKNPRAACFALAVPGDIRISIKPSGGVLDFSALYHEMGHAEQYANTTEHAMEFKYLGEPTLTETYAFLSEYLLSNQAWLRQRSSMPVAVLKDFVKFQAFTRLYYVRRYCAKFLFEERYYRGEEHPQEIYASLLSHALGYKPLPDDKKRALTDMDPHYYSADYLRAWFLEAQLDHWLGGRYGVNWFENPEAGRYLLSLWARGDRLTPETLLVQLGERAITIGAWRNAIGEMLRLAAR
jgi:hypothetical protein